VRIAVLGIKGILGVYGGAEKHCKELYKRIARLGGNVTVFTRAPYVPRSRRTSRWNGINFIHLWSLKQWRIETPVHSILSLIICILKRPHIVHFHNIGAALGIGILKVFRIKIVLTYHSMNYIHQKWGWLARFVLKAGEYLGIKYADRVIVISKTVKEILEKKYPHRDFVWITNGVNLPMIVPPGETLKKYNLSPGKYVFTVSRFEPEKGLLDLVEAYSRLHHPDFKLVIAGDADRETLYSRRIKKIAGKKQGIILTGFISDKPLAELYSCAGLIVLPSYYEGLSIALLEAISYGIPVLASDIPQNRDIGLKDFRYYPLGNLDLLSKKMQELLEKGISPEEKSEQVNLLRKNYNWDKIALETFELYKGILNSAV